jgi:hypothetical protein
MSLTGNIILGIAITLVEIGFIVLIIRLVITLAKIFLVLAIIVSIIMGIYYLVQWVPYAWENYVMSDMGKTIIILAAIIIAAAAILKKALRNYLSEKQANKNKKIFDRELVAGQVNITGQSIVPNGEIRCVTGANLKVENEEVVRYIQPTPEDIEWYSDLPNFRGH